MLQMSSMLRGGGGGGLGSFPAPGMPSTAGNASQTSGGAGAGTATGTGAGGSPPAMPFFNPFFPPPPTSSGTTGGDNANSNAANPFPMFDPAAMQNMMSAFGGMGGGLGGGFGAPAAPADSRPPEERFQVQLQVSAIEMTGNQSEADFDFT
jgi:ubiquilin